MMENICGKTPKINNSETKPIKIIRILTRLYKTNKLFAIGITICAIWILIALFANLIMPYDSVSQDLKARFSSPSSAHWLGTDNFGRDILSRIIIGSRLSLLAGLVTVSLASVIGTLYGGIAGFIGGIVDDVMMRISEMVSAFPSIILAMTITAALGPSLFNTLLSLVIVSWPGYARLMRSVVIQIKQNEYVESARALGTSNIRILFIEILPNSIGPILIMASLDIGNAILNFSGLSFLGLGSPPPAAEWGAMVADGIQNFNFWWITTFPGLAILTMSVGANFVGDGIRDFLDPKLRKEF